MSSLDFTTLPDCVVKSFSNNIRLGTVMDRLENNVSCLPASMEDKSKKQLPFHCGAFIQKTTKNRPSFSSKFNCECLFDDLG